ncbi:LrgB family protein [Brevibacillus massiliensis]|jgi:putative effector of murein hydrolase|uniref:LrgB family protein n=1 Tax=Brevibacillus massiliensis TaxID=1118054 RepID=UPI0002E89DCD|nr:LrgB family protein [Brevibacillus massiliensis]
MLGAMAICLTIFMYICARPLSERLFRIQPILIAAAGVGLIWWLFSGDWQSYAKGGSYISFWLGPATVALAVPLAKQLRQLARVWRAVAAGVAAGSAASMLSAWMLMKLLDGGETLTRSILSKSVTTPISVELTAGIGGNPSLAGLFTALTGIVGISIARPLLKGAGITDDWALGIAIGTSSHAIGTAGLLRHSQEQAAASSLAMILSGIITSVYFIPLQYL